MGVNGASLATVLSTFISFLIINVTQPKEIYIIFNSFSRENISEIVKTIKIKVFEKKNPDRLANKKDWNNKHITNILFEFFRFFKGKNNL